MAPLRPTVLAAGGVLWRERDGRLEVAVVHRPRYRDWSWPKGKLDHPTESLPACAVREVEEETGVAVVLGPPLPGLSYHVSDGRRKQVRYWAMRAAEPGDAGALAARGPVERAGEDEIDDVVWVRASTARDLLTRRGDVRALDRVVGLREQGRLDTRPVVVVRHGQAVPRKEWDGGDATRPLTAEGTRQARALVGVLAAFGTRSVVTSPWVRCTATTEPYVDAAGVEPIPVEALSQDAYAVDGEPARAVVRALLREPDGAAVVTHRPVLGGVVDVVGEVARRWTDGELPRTNPWLAAGEALVVHVAAARGRSRAVAVERHRP